MNRILSDLNAYSKSYMRTKVGPFFAFAFPVLLILLFGAIFSNIDSSTMTLHLQDLDATDASRGFIEALNATNFTVVELIPADADIEQYIKDESLGAALQVPAGFGQRLAQGNASLPPVELLMYGDPSRSSYGQAIGVVGGVADAMNFQLNQAVPIVGLEARTVASPEFHFIDYFLPGMLGMTMMFTAMYAMTGSVAEYKTRRYFKLLASTPITKWEWLTSKILFYLIITVASLALMMVVGVAVWGTRVAFTPVAFLFMVASAFLFTSLGVIIGAYSKDPESGAAMANAIGFPMMFLSGSFFNLEAMPSYMQSIAAIFPLTYVNNGLRDTMIFSNEASALTNLAIVSVMALVATAAATRLIQWTRD
jgi:ABC-2 type transport system permease protein